ncbi:hypothetical protein KC19_11G151200 [Ceratodon purpureus]|uniref:Exostosin GT47 domain-containing protein n=1 Tax=Ceratodon purpureus TaxID=3225 RepID=A0A8T0GIY5_CERPU|nr:hypothetical protein KC19_11G151200 [Ceratodon purpureus]
MAMQWHLRAQNRAYRPVKFSIGRCITLSTFIIFVFLLHLRIGADRRTIESPNVVPAIIQASERIESARNPTSSAGTKTPISELSTVAQEINVTSAISEVTDLGVTSETSEVLDTGVTSATSVDPDSGVTSANFQRPENCDGRRIFIYQMPVEFNEQLARNCHNWSGWRSMCEDISNLGFGVNIPLRKSDPMTSLLQPPSAWYRTEQFTLEVAIHERLKTHSCLTTNPDEASLFYIPFYHSLDLIRTLYLNDNLSARDLLGQRFVKWISTQAPWQRHQGHRHVLVLGRIYWDYIRGIGTDSTWGSNLLTLPELGNVTKLFIERSPWKSDTVGIPYPTSFHPGSETDLRAWQHTVRTSKRHQFASVAGGTRTKKLTGSIRDEVFKQCANSTKCKQVRCTHELCVTKPQTIIQMGLESVFCLQPPGDSPTRKGIFDSLQAGCIPVLFHEHQAVQQYLFHLPGNGLSYSVMIPQDDVAVNHYDVMDHLSRIPRSRIKKLQANIIKLLPQLLYRNPVLTGEYTSKDAVDVAIDGLLERFQVQSVGGHPSS